MAAVKTPYRKTRDPETIDKMVTDYLPLVRYIVGRLPLQLPRFMDEDDLISVGVLGLIHAAKTYDPDMGASFKTYAYTNIRGAILDELRRHDTLPRSMRDRMKKVEEATERLLERLGRVPTPEEIAAEAEIPVKALDEILLAVRTTAFLSLDEAGPPGEHHGPLLGVLADGGEWDPSSRAEKAEMLELLGRAIRNLPETERKVVFLYYNQNLLLREIGAVLEVSESRVSQILGRAHFLLNKEIKNMGG